jgi:hypothetical protein
MSCRGIASFVFLSTLWVTGCGGDTVETLKGEFLALTYNVAGLPEGISKSHPEEYTPQISPLLNAYDLALVQEDFWYHQELSEKATHPYRSDPAHEDPTLEELGDGLNRFSIFPMQDHQRVAWEACNGLLEEGADCLTHKGYSVARHELAPAIFVDVYNLHLDAGSEEGDQQARQAQVEQFLEGCLAKSDGEAIIVAGDTNLKPEREDRPLDAVSFDRLLTEAGLKDACREVGCPEERIDRILFRSSRELRLTPIAYNRRDDFVDPEGNDLSDHLPVEVRFSWLESGE